MEVLNNYKIVQETDVILTADVKAGTPVTAAGAIAGAGAKALGIATVAGEIGDKMRLAVAGECDVVFSAAVTNGDAVEVSTADGTVTSQGRFRTFAAGVKVGVLNVAEGKSAPAAAGDIARLVFNFLNT